MGILCALQNTDMSDHTCIEKRRVLHPYCVLWVQNLLLRFLPCFLFVHAFFSCSVELLAIRYMYHIIHM